jgi:hypothetical protein
MTDTPAGHRKIKPHKPRHSGVVRIDPELLAAFFDLPEDHHIVAFETTNDPVGLLAIVHGPKMPLVPPEARSPFIHIQVEMIDFGKPGLQFYRPRLIFPEQEADQ